MTRRWRARVAWGVVVIIVASLAYWAGRTFAEPPADPVASPVDVAYTVADGEVGFAQTFAGQATWLRSPTTPAAADGTVTSIDLPADGVVGVGQTVLTVNLRPVIVAAGDVPAFRALRQGDRGRDVAQLQALLRGQGYGASDSGVFDSATARAVRAWQRASGFPVDGVVAAGDLLFLPQLPQRLALAEDVRLGSVVSAGQTLFDVLSDTPSITVTLDQAQVATVPMEAHAVVRAGGESWDGVIATSVTADDGSLVLSLAAADGGPICGESCRDAIPPAGARNMAVDIVVTPSTTGPVIPTSAIRTTPGGQTVVRMADGTDRPVEVLASARGLAVVSDIVAGDQVLVPAAATEP